MQTRNFLTAYSTFLPSTQFIIVPTGFSRTLVLIKLTLCFNDLVV